MLIKAWANFSATGWTVVEPASVISPESSPGLEGVVGLEGVEGVDGFDGVDGLEGLAGTGFEGVVGAACVHPANIIAITSSIDNGNKPFRFFHYFLHLNNAEIYLLFSHLLHFNLLFERSS